MLEFYQRAAERQAARCSSSSTTSPRRRSPSIETILHTNERPSRGRFHEGRGTDYRAADGRDAHLRDRPVQRPQRLGRVGRTSTRETTVPGLYAAGDMACVPHNYMLGAFVYGRFAGENAAGYCADTSTSPRSTRARSRPSARACWRRSARATAFRPARSSTSCGAWSTTTCSRPRSRARCELGLERFGEIARGPRRSMHGARPARADARDGGAPHPRLRRDGGARVALPHREPLGPVPLPRRLPRAQRRRTGSCHCQAAQGRDGRMASVKRAGRALHRAARRRREDRLPAPAHRQARRPPRPERNRPCRYATPCAPAFPSPSTRTSASPHKGCTVCVDVCPLDVLRHRPESRARPT